MSMPTFELRRDQGNPKRLLLSSRAHQMEFVVIDAGLEKNINVPPKKNVYVAIYGGGEGNGSVAYFFLKTYGVGVASREWDDNMILAGIHHYTRAQLMGTLGKVLDHSNGRSMYHNSTFNYVNLDGDYEEYIDYARPFPPNEDDKIVEPVLKDYSPGRVNAGRY